MPVNGGKLQFTETNVNLSPDKPGVYVLYVDGHLIYYGSSEKSVRSRLQDHLAGREGGAMHPGHGRCSASRLP